MNTDAADLVILLERVLMRAAIDLDAAMVNAGDFDWRTGVTFRVTCDTDPA